jgi:hypothetical protein
MSRRKNLGGRKDRKIKTEMEGFFMADKLKALKDRYLKKQTEKPELQRPQHAEKYAEKAKRSVQRSKKNHQAAS